MLSTQSELLWDEPGPRGTYKMAPLKSSTRPSPSKPRLPCYVCTVPLLQPSAQSRQQWLIPGRAASAASNFYVDRGIPIISIPPRPDQASDRARVSRAKSEQFTFRARFIARPPSELHHVAAHDGRTDGRADRNIISRAHGRNHGRGGGPPPRCGANTPGRGLEE